MITSVPVKFSQVKYATNPDDLVKSEGICLKPKSRKSRGANGERIVFPANAISVQTFGSSYGYWDTVVLSFNFSRHYE